MKYGCGVGITGCGVGVTGCGYHIELLLLKSDIDTI